MNKALLLFVLALLHLFPSHARAQQEMSTDEILDLLVGQKITLTNGTMEFFTDWRVETLTHAGRVFRGTYTISEGVLCRDYGASGGLKCYRVFRGRTGYSIVDNANVALNFTVPGGRKALPSARQATPNESDQRESEGTHPQIARVLRGRDGAGMILSGTTIVSGYAIQKWRNGPFEGMALLKHSPSSGWQLVVSGGGALSASHISAEYGVPRDIAERLCPTQAC